MGKDVVPTRTAELKPRLVERPGMYESDIEEFRGNFETTAEALEIIGSEVKELLALTRAAAAGDKEALQMIERVGVVGAAVGTRSDQLTQRVEGLAKTLAGLSQAIAEKRTRDEKLSAQMEAVLERGRVKEETKGQRSESNDKTESRVEKAIDSVVSGQADLAEIVMRELGFIRAAVERGQQTQQTAIPQRAEQKAEAAPPRPDGAATVDRILEGLGKKSLKDRGRTPCGRRFWLAGRCRIIEAGGQKSQKPAPDMVAEVLGAVDEANKGRAKGDVAVVVAVGAAEAAIGESRVAEEAARRRVFIVDTLIMECFVKTANAATPGGGAPSVAEELQRLREEIQAVGTDLRSVQGTGSARARLAEVISRVDKLRGPQTGATAAQVQQSTPQEKQSGGQSTPQPEALASSTSQSKQAATASPGPKVERAKTETKEATNGTNSQSSGAAQAQEEKSAKIERKEDRAEDAVVETGNQSQTNARPDEGAKSPVKNERQAEGGSSTTGQQQQQQRQSLSAFTQTATPPSSSAETLGRSSWQAGKGGGEETVAAT